MIEFQLNKRKAWVDFDPEQLFDDYIVRVYTHNQKFSILVDFFNLPERVQYWVKDEYENRTGYDFDRSQNEMFYMQEMLIKERM